MSAQFSEVWRSKGMIWIASRNDTAGEWSQAGNVFALEPLGTWAACLSPADWPEDDETRQEIEEVWEEPHGNRRTELVLIGQHLNQERVTAELQECLLTDEELAAGPAVWNVFEDPFNSWELTGSVCDLEDDLPA